MKEITVCKGKTIRFNQREVFRLLDCREDSPIYQEMLASFQEVQDELKDKIYPLAALTFGRMDEHTEVLFCILTLGEEVDSYISTCFENGDYLKGMLADTMSVNSMSNFEPEVIEVIHQLCQKRKVGIKCRHEAPNDIPMEMQRTAFDALDAGNSLQLKITDGFMFQPLKSYCAIFELSKNENDFFAEHNCETCPNTSCKMRKSPPI